MFLFIFMNVDEDKKRENQVWLAQMICLTITFIYFVQHLLCVLHC